MKFYKFVAMVTMLAGLVPGVTYSQEYPEHPIRFIVPYAPGGSLDIVARIVADVWSARLGQPLIVENRSGAAGNIGIDLVAKSKPDGYTIGIQTVSLAINPGLFAKMPFDTLHDLAPVGMVAASQHVLVVNNQFKAQNLQELIALVKANPNKYNYGSGGSGTPLHMGAELLKSMANLNITHIAYRGGGPALTDTIGGQVDMSIPLISAVIPMVKAGKLRALGVTGDKRSPLLPEVPTIAEAGVPGYNFQTWFMVFVPTNTDAAIVAKLNSALNAALKDPVLIERMSKQGLEATPSTPEQAKERLVKEMPVWAKLIKERGITPE